MALPAAFIKKKKKGAKKVAAKKKTLPPWLTQNNTGRANPASISKAKKKAK
jgi:hypothetical protein